jgi:hypothetical protein
LTAHPFIFQPGCWEGTGYLHFSMADDKIFFKSVWQVEPEKEGVIMVSQTVTIEELDQKMANQFVFKEMSEGKFAIQLTNPVVTAVQGSGVIDPKRIAWEFREQGQNFEGFEIYEATPEGYSMRGEYSGAQSVRTYVKGQIQKVS